jgi:uncharacterized protein YbcI
MTVTMLAVSRSAAISKLAIRLMSRYAGRGPTKARSYLNDDMVTIVMSDLLTKPQSSLLDNGQTDLVRRDVHPRDDRTRRGGHGARAG